MKRSSMLIAAVVTMLLFARPALAVNLHNGVIVVHNNTNNEIVYHRRLLLCRGFAVSDARVSPRAPLQWAGSSPPSRSHRISAIATAFRMDTL